MICVLVVARKNIKSAVVKINVEKYPINENKIILQNIKHRHKIYYTLKTYFKLLIY